MMNDRLYLVWLLLFTLVLVIFISSHSWMLLAPALHLRTLLLGLYPILLFIPPAHLLLSKTTGFQQLTFQEQVVYTTFTAIAMVCGLTFVLISLNLAYLWLFAFITLLMLLLFWYWWREFFYTRRWLRISELLPPLSTFFLILICFALLILATAALLPPLDYDAHEYHFPVPLEYLAQHGWIPFELNVYAGFPMNVELLYLWALMYGSTAACTVQNLVFYFMTVLVLIRLAALWGFERFSVWAVLIFLSTGLILQMLIHGSIDPALTFLAGLLLLSYERHRSHARAIDLWMMILALGFALGAKYIAIIAILIPFAVMVAADALISHRMDLLKTGWLVLAGGFILFCPWLLRNLWLYQNPLYPLLNPLFSGEPQFYHEVFARAHQPPEESFSEMILQFLWIPLNRSLGEKALPFGYGFIWLLGLPLVWHIRKQAALLRVLIFASTIYVIWFFLSQRNDRFLAPLLPLLALFPVWAIHSLTSPILQIWALRLIAVGVIFQLWSGFLVVFVPETVEFLRSPMLEEDYFVENLEYYRTIQWLNQQKAQGMHVDRVLFIGEARTYGSRFEAIAPTVFNFHPLQQGIPLRVTHIIYNQYELERLQKGYGPMGWHPGDQLKSWVEQNRGSLLLPVYDAYPENPGRIVVYAVQR
jgi:hypothetical protein